MTKNDKTELRRPNLKGIEQNKTTMFMLPAIALNSERMGYRLLQYFGFVNCYLKHEGGSCSCTDCLYMVFNPTSEALKKFKDFYEIYKTYPNYIEDYIVDAHLIVVVFRVRHKWKATLESFKLSKYSQMSKEYAEIFKTPLINGNVQISEQYYIIHKNEDFKKYLEEKLSLVTKDFKDIVIIDKHAELMSPLNPELEEFQYKILNHEPTKIFERESECKAESPGP